MNWHLIIDVLPLLLEGALLTAQLTALSISLGLVIALPLSLMRASTVAALSRAVLLYTFVFRGTPLLVQLFLIYYGASQIEWIRSSFAWVILREPFWCALIAFSLNNAAYTTEILRGGIRAVPRGEVEAAKALGLPVPMTKGAAVASEAFLPFADGLLSMIAAGATAVIQPGGSMRDQEVIDAANEHGIAMVFTGMRHFRH